MRGPDIDGFPAEGVAWMASELGSNAVEADHDQHDADWASSYGVSKEGSSGGDSPTTDISGTPEDGGVPNGGAEAAPPDG